MQLEETLLQEHSKAQKDKIVNWIGGDQKKFDALFKIFKSNDALLIQRAAWPMSDAVIAHPQFIKKHFSDLLQLVQNTKWHNAVKRNGMRLMEDLAIPEEHQGTVMTICFDALNDPQEKVAVKASCISILTNLAKAYPEIKQELITTVENLLPHTTAAVKARAKNLLKLQAD